MAKTKARTLHMATESDQRPEAEINPHHRPVKMVAAMKAGVEKRAKEESPVKKTVDRTPKVISQAFSRNGSLRSGRETHSAPVAAATAAGNPNARPMQRPVSPTPTATDRPFSRWGRNTARAREEGVEGGEKAILSEWASELCFRVYRPAG